MILLPEGRKILMIAASLFIATFSLVLFVVSGDQPGHGANLKTSVFEDFFHHGAAPAEHEETSDVSPAITLDSHGAILDANETFEHDFGYTAKDLRGKSFFTVIASEDLPHFAGDYASAVSSKKIVINNGPYRLISHDDTAHLVLITYTPESSKSGQAVITLTLKDISPPDPKNGDKPSKGKAIKELDTQTKDGKSEKNRIIVEKTS